MFFTRVPLNLSYLSVAASAGKLAAAGAVGTTIEPDQANSQTRAQV
jgi:hypothetical protein